MDTAIAIGVGFMLDLLFGDPRFLPHPVCAIGRLISFLDHKLRPACHKNQEKEKRAGILLAVLVPAATMAVVCFLLKASYIVSPELEFMLKCFWTYQILAAGSLHRESRKVYRALKHGKVEEARKAVAMIVGRDTDSLDEEGITKAAIETVAENTSDGIIAPLLFLFCFGVPGGFFYKAVNTMDSMIGYKNDTYLYFGRAAAKLDDLCNFVPARISALFMILAAGLFGYSVKNGFRIWRRDCRKHASPNSAQTEAACAGILGIRLAGDAWYFGTLYKKPYIGDAVRPVEAEDIKRSWYLMYESSCLVFIIGMAAYITMI